MSDNTVTTPAQEFEQQFRRMAAMIRTCMPGKVVSFDASTQRASVLPGIKMKVVLDDQVTYEDMPVITNVPITIPMGFGGNAMVTFPIRSGDPCMIMFADRAIDNFLQSGESENPGNNLNEDTTTPRSHHLSDAICMPGLVADPQVIPEWNNDSIELRDHERKNYTSLNPSVGLETKMDNLPITAEDGSGNKTTLDGAGNVILNSARGGVLTLDDTGRASLTDASGSTLDLDGAGNINISDASGNRLKLGGSSGIELITSGPITLIGSNMTIDGRSSADYTIKQTLKSTEGSFVTRHGIDLSTHVHSGVQSGGSNTAGPVI